MFTGIVEDKGRVARVEYRGQVRRLTLEVPVGLTEMNLGDSINVNGACLTLVERKGQAIVLDLSSETLEKTTLSGIREGDQVNLERALRLSDRMGGHIVTGHVDGIGVITAVKKEGDFLHLKVQIPSSASRYVVRKGSVAIDGISLTVNECQGEEIEMTLIPHTIEKTTLFGKKTGDRVNVEADILGKYVEKILDREAGKREGLTDSFLAEHGFIRSD